MTKYQLFAALVAGQGSVLTVAGVTGLIQSVQREDGSGRSFNVTLLVNGKPVTKYVRTVD